VPVNAGRNVSGQRNPYDLIFAGIVGALTAVLIMFGFTWATDGGNDTTTTTRASSSTTAPASTSTTAPATTTSTTTTVATTTTTEATTTTSFPGDTSTKTASGDQFGIVALLADVRVAQREGFTRVVFEYEADLLPWWEVGYEPGPFLATSGEEVEVDGAAFLQVLMSAGGVDLSGEEPRITYEGSGRIEAGTAGVVEMVRVEDFEGFSVWVIGVPRERPFLVGTLEGPPRLYIDIAD
jgi:hypothetical protein